MSLMTLVEKNYLPDALLRLGIRSRVAARLRELEASGDPGAANARFAEDLRRLPLAVHAEDANRQHYELPPAFFERVLGPRLKYSSAYWGPGTRTLAEAEETMLGLYAERAEIEDGQEILDLGCGWGSLSLYLAERFPRARILGVSNSRPQREFIEARAKARGLDNVEILTSDIASLRLARTFDRIVSVEMFEHLKNYEQLMDLVTGRLRSRGKLFVHVFTHRRYAYHFEDRGPGDWMARHFFTGGLMPSDDLLPRFRGSLSMTGHWQLSGTHYRKTADAWLANMEARRGEILPVFAGVYGADEARRWWGRWRIFFMACAELFGYADGTEWQVSHYVFRNP